MNEDAKNNIKKPGFCCLGIVDSCMLRCHMCEKWKEDLVADKPHPTLEQYKTFIRQLREITDEGFEIDIGGGEALMRPDVLDLVRYATDLGFKTTIASNGWLIDETMAQRVVDSGLTSIILSLDSLNPAVHDEMRGVKGVSERVHRAIDLIRSRSRDIHIGICSIVMNKTIDGVLALEEWANGSRDRINSILFMAAMQPNNTYTQEEWHKHYGELWPDNVTRVFPVLDELIARRKAGHWIGNSVEQLEAFKSYFKNPNQFVKKTSCNMDRGLHVSAVGDIFLCFRWDILGNIQNGGDIREIWYSAEAEKVREDIRSCQDNCHFLLNCFFEGDYPFECDVKEQSA